jgi:hypothetical protein
MQRLTIHLSNVEPSTRTIKGKERKILRNTVSYTVKSQKDITHHLSMHSNNIKKHYISNFSHRPGYKSGKPVN